MTKKLNCRSSVQKQLRSFLDRWSCIRIQDIKLDSFLLKNALVIAE